MSSVVNQIPSSTRFHNEFSTIPRLDIRPRKIGPTEQVSCYISRVALVAMSSCLCETTKTETRIIFTRKTFLNLAYCNSINYDKYAFASCLRKTKRITGEARKSESSIVAQREYKTISSENEVAGEVGI